MEEQAKLLADLTATISSMNSKLKEMHPVVLDLSSWRPMIERNMDNLRAEVGDLRTRMSERCDLLPLHPRAQLHRHFVPSRRTRLHSYRRRLNRWSLRPATSRPRMVATATGDSATATHRTNGVPIWVTLCHPKGPRQRVHFTILVLVTIRLILLAIGNSLDFLHHLEWIFSLFEGENPRAWRLRCEAYF
jgi:hypothetical protein